MNHPDEELDEFDFEDYSDDLAALTDEQIAELYFINEQNGLPVDTILQSSDGAGLEEDLTIMLQTGIGLTARLCCLFTHMAGMASEGSQLDGKQYDAKMNELLLTSHYILKVEREVEAEFSGTDPSWSRGENNVQDLQAHYSEPDSRDLRHRSAQCAAPVEERYWEAIRDRDFSGRSDDSNPRQHDG